MTVVIDSSVILKWVLPEPDSAAAFAVRSSEGLAAPTIWIAEAGNALWKHAIRGTIDATEAQELLFDLLSSPIATSPIETDIDAALRLATDLNHPIYDCLYLALALRTDSYVVTADRRFVDLGGRRGDLSGRIRPLA